MTARIKRGQSMKKFLFPYGNTPFEILINCAKEEFGPNQINANSYTRLKTEIRCEINRHHTDKRAVYEYYLKTLSEKEHHNQYHLVSYFSMKYSAYAFVISVLSLIISHFGSAFPSCLFDVMLIWMAITVILSYRGVHKQQGQVEYIQFKLRCLEEIVKPKT